MLQRFVLPVADVGQGLRFASGAKLYFYEPGTTIPKNTYNDVNGIFPHTNPVVADSSGTFPSIFLTGTYKVQLTDKNDSQKWVEPAVQYDYTFDSASETALTEFAADGADVIADFDAYGAAAISIFNNNGAYAITEFGADSAAAITVAIDSVLQSIDGVVSPGVNQDFGFIAQPVTQIIDNGSLA